MKKTCPVARWESDLSLAGISCPVDYFDTMSDRRALVEIKESPATRRLASNCSSKEPFQHDKNRKFFAEIRFAHLVLHRYKTSKELTHETHYPIHRRHRSFAVICFRTNQTGVNGQQERARGQADDRKVSRGIPAPRYSHPGENLGR